MYNPRQKTFCLTGRNSFSNNFLSLISLRKIETSSNFLLFDADFRFVCTVISFLVKFLMSLTFIPISASRYVSFSSAHFHFFLVQFYSFFQVLFFLLTFYNFLFLQSLPAQPPCLSFNLLIMLHSLPQLIFLYLPTPLSSPLHTYFLTPPPLYSFPLLSPPPPPTPTLQR